MPEITLPPAAIDFRRCRHAAVARCRHIRALRAYVLLLLDAATPPPMIATPLFAAPCLLRLFAHSCCHARDIWRPCLRAAMPMPAPPL